MKNFIQKTAHEAGKEILKQFRKKQNYNFKRPSEVVTQADLKSDKIITSAIQKKFPSHQIISEESKPKKTKSDYQWIIDPIDGTTNFILGLPLFCVMIALSYKGTITHGLEYFPTSKKTYYAELGKGATLNNKKIKVSDKTDLKQCFLTLNHAKDAQGRNKQFAIHKKSKELKYIVKDLGCAGVVFAMLASGKIDGNMSWWNLPWDLAAGSLLVKEAGGKITDYENKPWTLESKNILATNGKIHNKLLKLIKNA
ncbi:inositol monophosphatase [Patescibacteria group bacterium]|nr:inositol monophosphatase [Patescibacteria group bacterium]